jgi:hypothetical protein
LTREKITGWRLRRNHKRKRSTVTVRREDAMLKKIDLNDATLASIFLETKALQGFLTDPNFTEERGFYDLAHDVIDEVYGKPDKSDFDNISAMCWFYTPKQNVLLKLLQDRGTISKKQGYREPVRTSSFKEWSKQHP